MHTRRLFPTLSGFVCAALALFAAGCQQDKITTHHVPKPANNDRLLAVMVTEPDLDRVWFFKLAGPIEKIDAHEKEFDQFIASIRFTRRTDDGVHWDLPAGWTEEKGSGLRKRTLIIGDKKDDLAVSVTTLGQMADALPMNLNRWRKQVGLTSLPASETYDTTETIRVGGLLADKIDLKGPGNPLAKAPQTAMPLREDKGPGFDYKVPEPWMKSPKNVPLAIVTFRPKNDDKYVVTVSPARPQTEGENFLLDNINRWRGQVSLPKINRVADAENTAPVKVGDQELLLYDMTGKQKLPDMAEPGPPHRILAVALKRGDVWWYFKLTGPPDEVGTQRKAFEDFLGSVRFDADREPQP